MSNFNALRPDVNVLNIKGPGSKSIRDAALAWSMLADELCSNAVRWDEQLFKVSEVFQGYAAEQFIKASGLYKTWLYQHAVTASGTIAHLDEAADAYEKAVTSMVPWTSIAVNRSAVLTLKTTNFFGQFTTKIAELDDIYQEMRAQNADAMNTYQSCIFTITQRAEETKIVPAPMAPMVSPLVLR